MINADNGPENNTGRTQWIKRLVEFSTEHRVTVKLAAYAELGITGLMPSTGLCRVLR